jgi:hypothetical protein
MSQKTQYIEIDFNREIRLCYIRRGTPSKSDPERAHSAIIDRQEHFDSLLFECVPSVEQAL